MNPKADPTSFVCSTVRARHEAAYVKTAGLAGRGRMAMRGTSRWAVVGLGVMIAACSAGPDASDTGTVASAQSAVKCKPGTGICTNDLPTGPNDSWPTYVMANLSNTAGNAVRTGLGLAAKPAFLTSQLAERTTTAKKVTPFASFVVPDPHLTGLGFANGDWEVFNEDAAAMPLGAAFNVLATSDKISPVVQNGANAYEIAIPKVTNSTLHVFAAYIGSPGVVASLPVAVEYLGGTWSVTTANKAVIPNGTEFQFVVAEQLNPTPNLSTTTLTVTASASSLSGGAVIVDSPILNKQPTASLFITPNLSAGTAPTAPLAVSYDSAIGQWLIVASDGTLLSAGMAFNVLGFAPAAPPAPSCSDGIKNGNETDVDCGGGTCPGCPDLKACLVNSDCIAGDDCYAFQGGHACGPI
jgi:hypothetical protein